MGLASLVGLALLGCSDDIIGSDDELGSESDTGDESSDATEASGPLLVLVAGQGRVWVSDLSEPGVLGTSAEVVTADTQPFVDVRPSPDARRAAIITSGNAGSLSVAVWLHDLVAAPFEPAAAIPVPPDATSAELWWAADGSPLVVETRSLDTDEHHLFHVGIDDAGPSAPLEVPDVPGFVYDAGYVAGGTHLILRIAGVLYISQIIEGQPQAPVRVPEFEGALENRAWALVGDVLVYDTITPVDEFETPPPARLHRRELATWPLDDAASSGPVLWGGANWWLSPSEDRVIARLDSQALAIAEVDMIDTYDELPGATNMLGMSPDGRFAFMTGTPIAGLVHELLVFDLEGAAPLDGLALGLVGGAQYDLEFGERWAVWPDMDCVVTGIDLSGSLDTVGPQASHGQLFGAAFAPATNRLYVRALYDDGPDQPSVRIRDLDALDSPAHAFAHPFGPGEQLHDLAVSPHGERHVYTIVTDSHYDNLALWDESAGSATLLGPLGGLSLDSLWVPGERVSVPLALTNSCL